MFKFLSKIWRLLSGNLKWHILWLFHDKFIIGTSAIIYNEKDEVLLLQHRFWKQDSWGLPSGYAEKREKLEDAIQREIKEETNLDVTIGSLLNINSGFKLRLEITFLGRCADISILKINNNEILNAKFFPKENLPEGLLPSHKKLINNA